jgi:beta-glucanase (GH16 family)
VVIMPTDRSAKPTGRVDGARRRRHRARYAAIVAVTAGGAILFAATLPHDSSQHAGSPPRSGLSQPSSPPVPASSAAPAAPAAPGPWHPIFQDVFSGTRLNPANWVTCYDWNDNGCTNAGNHELEWFEPGQVSVGGGALTLSAQRRTVTGSNGLSYPWVSGMVSTGRSSYNADPRFTFTYGYVSADIELGVAPGMYEAFWLLPADKAWPPEIDILESAYPQNDAQMNLHYVGTHGNSQAQYVVLGPGEYASGYHNYAVDWEPGRITWYIDGVPRYTLAGPFPIPDTPMEIVATLAVGLPSAPPASTASAAMKIKDVRVWQH